MKKISILLCVCTLNAFAISDSISKINLISSERGKTVIQFNLQDGLVEKLKSVNDGIQQVISFDKGSPILKKGAPDLQKFTTSIIIPDMGDVSIQYSSLTQQDIHNVLISPSKGNLYRNVNPKEVPYSFGPEYVENAFYPKSIESLSSPYILRDHRGITINICPIQYNPITKTVRIHTNVIVTITTNENKSGVNELNRVNSETIVDGEFEAIYGRKFLNYVPTNTIRSSSVSENGSMLIICENTFSTSMQPFVIWKNKKGIETEMVLKSITGNTSSAIKSYISNYYSTHPTLKYVLLVGDAPKIPSSKTSSGDSDNDYGYLAGNDSYPEIFIGRFSATTSSQVQTMVNRTIRYEQTPQANATWYKKGITIGSSEGPGDDNEIDFEHQRNLRGQMLAYTYNNVSENYDGSQGGIDAAGDPSASSIGAQINNGVGVITYTGHGSDVSFGTTGYSSPDIAKLTNTTMHPFVWSVACVNGNFVNTECFAEAWLRAGTPSQPTGALATFMSTINQSWNPPMEGQDEMINILTESSLNNIKRTFGGISMNGCIKMNDVYDVSGFEMTDTWTCFGDPSVMLYSSTPMPMITSHVSSVAVGTIAITVNCNVNNALICLSRNGIILGTGIANSGSAVISIPSATLGVIDVVATAYNKMPYSGMVNVGSTGVNDNNNKEFFSIYPNPVNASLTISSFVTSGKAKMILFNELGQEVLTVFDQEITNSFNKTIDVTDLRAGVYFMKLESDNTVTTKRVIIQK